MGLDAAVYADDDCDHEVASVRIGNLDAVVRIRTAIEEKFPEAAVLRSKVLYSAFHCGDALENDDIARAKNELDELLRRCPDDPLVMEFVVRFGGILALALQHRRPVTFT